MGFYNGTNPTNPTEKPGTWYWELEMTETEFAAFAADHEEIASYFYKFQSSQYTFYYCEMSVFSFDDLAEFGIEFGEVFISLSTQPAIMPF